MKKLNIGCGYDIREGYTNTDIFKHKGITYLDINKFPYPFKSNVFDYVVLRGVLHLSHDPYNTLNEVYRICSNGAIIDLDVLYYNCITHTNHFKTFDIKFFNRQAYKENNKQKDINFAMLGYRTVPTSTGRFIPNPSWFRLRDILAKYITNINHRIIIRLLVNKKVFKQKK